MATVTHEKRKNPFKNDFHCGKITATVCRMCFELAQFSVNHPTKIFDTPDECHSSHSSHTLKKTQPTEFKFLM